VPSARSTYPVDNIMPAPKCLKSENEKSETDKCFLFLIKMGTRVPRSETTICPSKTGRGLIIVLEPLKAYSRHIMIDTSNACPRTETIKNQSLEITRDARVPHRVSSDSPFPTHLDKHRRNMQPQIIFISRCTGAIRLPLLFIELILPVRRIQRHETRAQIVG